MRILIQISCLSNIRDLKIRGRRWQRKLRLKSEFSFCWSSSRLFLTNSVVLSIVGELSWSWIPKDHVQVQNEKENFVVACLRSQQNVKLGIFTS